MRWGRNDLVRQKLGWRPPLGKEAEMRPVVRSALQGKTQLSEILRTQRRWGFTIFMDREVEEAPRY